MALVRLDWDIHYEYMIRETVARWFRSKIEPRILEPKRTVAVLLIWTVSHLFVFVLGVGNRGYHYRENLWPIWGNDSLLGISTSSYRRDVFNFNNFSIKNYDLIELFFYVIAVWTAYGVYLLLKDAPAMGQGSAPNLNKQTSEIKSSQTTVPAQPVSDSSSQFLSSETPLHNEIFPDYEPGPKPSEWAIWRRFFAKIFDLKLFGLIGLSILQLIGFLNLFSDISSRLGASVVFGLIFGVLLESLSILMTGTTPFKALFGIAIVSPDPQPNWNQAFTRTFWSYFQGAWLFIPPFCLIPMNRSKKRLSAGVMMTWDLKSGLSTRHIKMFKGVVIVVFVVSIVILSSLNRLFDMNARFVQSSQVPVTLVADSGNLSNATLVQQGQAIFERQCTACHTAGKNKLIGPGLAGLYGSKVELVDGSKVTADDNYIRESIENPNAKITKGFPPAMTPFKGLISDSDMIALIAFIKTLK